MVKDGCKAEYLFAMWMQAGGQHKYIEHILKLHIKKHSSSWWQRSNSRKARTQVSDAKVSVSGEAVAKSRGARVRQALLPS